MSTNKNILNAKNVKKNPFRDEFYTTRRTIEYLFKDIDKQDFAGKTVYCNCDLPWIKERWDVVRFVEEPVIVNGKNRFYRFELRRKEGVEI